MHDTKKASVELNRGELELLLQLLATQFAKEDRPDSILQVSQLYNTLSRAKGSL